MSWKDVEEERVMHSKSGNIEFMSCYNEIEVTDQLFESFLSRYQIGFETSMRGSDFIFDSVQLLYFKCHKLTLENVDIYWFSRLEKKKKTAIIQNNDDHKLFQYATTISLNFKEFKKYTQRVSNVKSIYK